MEHEIDGIQWFDRALGHQGIRAIGNRQGKWGLSVASALVRMEAGQRYFVIDPMTSKKVYIHAVKPEGEVPYLRTYLVDRWTDHLLALHVMQDMDLID